MTPGEASDPGAQIDDDERCWPEIEAKTPKEALVRLADAVPLMACARATILGEMRQQ
jgi:hypothetical protein